MSSESLQDLLESSEDPVGRMRNLEIGTNFWSALPQQFTHWIEEQRAASETCILADQSFHMADLYIEGPEALDLLSDVGVNSFENFRSGSPPQAKQLVVCNHDGYLIGDGILFHLDDDQYLAVGHFNMHNWIQFNIESSDYDVRSRLADDPISEGPVEAGRFYPANEGPPEEFRFEVQGPNALEVLAEIVDHPLPDISFFQMDTITINGKEIYALAHGMSSVPGWELFGPFEYHDEIKQDIMTAGAEYGIHEVGRRSYLSGGLRTGWFPVPVPAIYDSDEMKSYRKWLGADSYEARLGLGGSFESDEIEDYYMDPVEMGYGRVINFDHEFIGKTALEDRVENPKRTNVTYVWDDDDVLDVFGSLFRKGETHKFMDLPASHNSKWESRFDKVVKDGEIVGVSKWCGYDYNVREYLSMGVIEVDYSDPGTQVEITWGDAHQQKNHVERHSQTDISATVAPSPYSDEGRRDI